MTLRRRFLVFLLVTGAISASAFGEDLPEARQGGLFRNRAQFAEAMARVSAGMGKAEVLAILGTADDARPVPQSAHHQSIWKEIWNYGSRAPSCFATLGRVYFDGAGRVLYTFGGRRCGSDACGLPEGELRVLLEIINAAPAYYGGSGFNPALLIRAVNRLQPLGKERALAVIDEYLRVSGGFGDSGREGVFLVLRVLFDVPEDTGQMPPMRVGQLTPVAPSDPTLFPRFPLVLVDDVPLFLTYGYSLGGVPQPPEQHVAYFRERGKVRKLPLRPGGMPLAVYDKLVDSVAWRTWNDELSRTPDPLASLPPTCYRMLIGNQLLRLVETAAEVPLLPLDSKQTAADCSEWSSAWQNARDKIAGLCLRWDPDMSLYTTCDGSFLSRSWIIGR